MFYAERIGGEKAERGIFLSIEEFLPYRKRGWSGTPETDKLADDEIRLRKMKFCRDCKYCKVGFFTWLLYGFEYAKCAKTLDCATGKPKHYCQTERMVLHQNCCGEDAKWFVPKYRNLLYQMRKCSRRSGNTTNQV